MNDSVLVYWKTRTQTPDKRWKTRTNDGKHGQTMEKTDKFSNTFELKFWSNFGWCHIYCQLI